MYTYDRTAATINQGTLDKLQKEFRLLTKIYRSIEAKEWASESERAEDIERWDEAREIFTRWRDNFTEFAYKVLLPQNKSNAFTKEVEKDVWNLRHTLEAFQLFPTDYPSRQRNFDEFRRNREKMVKRYQVAATKCFKTLETWLYNREYQVEDAVKHFEVSGVNVVILNQQMATDGSDQSIDPYLRRLKDKINDIRRAGFGKAVDGLEVTVNFEKEKGEGLTAAMYTPGTDRMTMLSLGLIQEEKGLHRTFTHEIGHRFYFKVLPSQARSHWEEVMTARGVTVTKEDVLHFADIVNRKVEQSGVSKMMEKEDRLQAVLPQAKSEEEEAKFRELNDTPLISFFGDESYSYSQYVQRLESNSVDQVVQLEEISEYANTSPMEAFAECFWMYVLKGPRALKPWTRGFFERICLAGGAKLASMKTGYTSVFDGINTGA